MKNFFYNIIGAAVFLGMSITPVEACENEGLDVHFEAQIIQEMYDACVENKEYGCEKQRDKDTENLLQRMAVEKVLFLDEEGEEL